MLLAIHIYGKIQNARFNKSRKLSYAGLFFCATSFLLHFLLPTSVTSLTGYMVFELTLTAVGYTLILSSLLLLKRANRVARSMRDLLNLFDRLH